MKNILKYSITSSSIILLLSSCGDSSSQPTETKINQDSPTNIVYVERGPVLQSIVKDAAGNYATNKINTNEYTFKSIPTYPITATGGWIDINNDKNKTTNDILLDINLTSYSSNITPITTLLAESNTTKRELLENKLLTISGLTTKNDLYKLPSVSGKQNLAVLVNSIYKASKEQNSSINQLFSYKNLVTDSNNTLQNEFTSLNNETNSSIFKNGKIDSLLLEKFLYDQNNTLFTKVTNIAKLAYKEVYSTDDIESIWNITLPVNVGVDYSNFNIGVRFIKSENDGSDDMGDFVYKNMTIQNNTISSPEKLDIYGYGDNNSGGTYFDNSYDPDNVRASSLSLSGGTLNLNLGYVMKKQTVVSESKFKVATDYTLQIVASEPIFSDSTSMTLKLISNNYDFINKQGVSGALKIK